MPSEIEQAVATLEPGGRLVGVRALTGGVSANVFGLEIATCGCRHRRVVFRQHRADFKHHDRTVTAKEHAVLTALHREGLAVPEPYLYDDTSASTAPYLLMEWVDGSTDVAPDDLPRALDQMARFLVGLHALEPRRCRSPALEPIEDPRVAVVPYLPPTDVGRDVTSRSTPAPRTAPDVASWSTATSGPATSSGGTGGWWPSSIGRTPASVIRWPTSPPHASSCSASTATTPWSASRTAYLTMHEDTIGPLPLDSLPLWELYVSAAALASMGEWGLDPADEAHRRRHTERFFEGRPAARLTRRAVSR